jgi:glycosyltransferase involved in cell wall biosynthesis
VPAATVAGRELVSRHRFDAMLTTSPPDSVHLVGLALGVHPWIVDFRDPWIGLTYKRPPTPLHAWRQRRLRDSVLSRADLLLATTRASADLLRNAPARVEILPNGWDPDVTPPAAPARADGKLRLVYTGTLWDVPAASTFLSATARALATHGARDLEVELIGPHESSERKLVERLGLTGVVRFAGQVPYQESRRRQSAADVLLLLQVHGPGYDAAIPGKLYEYVASGRPILAFLPPGEAADLVRRVGGWVVAPEDASGAEQAIIRLLTGERPGGDSFDRRAISEEHRRDRIAHRLATLLDKARAR